MPTSFRRVLFRRLDRKRTLSVNLFFYGYLKNRLDGGIIMRKEAFFSAWRVAGMGILLALVVVLQAFGGIRGVKSAEKEQLEAVAGISRENAVQVWSYFHKKEEAKEETP